MKKYSKYSTYVFTTMVAKFDKNYDKITLGCFDTSGPINNKWPVGSIGWVQNRITPTGITVDGFDHIT